MDAQAFDRWTASLMRSLSAAGSRRALALAASAALGLSHLGGDAGVAKKGKGRKRKKRKNKRQSPAPPPAGPTCSDGMQNGSETGIDCGGGTCPRCAAGQTCASQNDCATGLCTGGACAQCVNAADCGLDSDGTGCACRDNATQPGQRMCTKLSCDFKGAGSTCAACGAGAQCAPAGDGIECCLPCGA